MSLCTLPHTHLLYCAFYKTVVQQNNSVQHFVVHLYNFFSVRSCLNHLPFRNQAEKNSFVNLKTSPNLQYMQQYSWVDALLLGAENHYNRGAKPGGFCNRRFLLAKMHHSQVATKRTINKWFYFELIGIVCWLDNLKFW